MSIFRKVIHLDFPILTSRFSKAKGVHSIQSVVAVCLSPDPTRAALTIANLKIDSAGLDDNSEMLFDIQAAVLFGIKQNGCEGDYGARSAREIGQGEFIKDSPISRIRAGNCSPIFRTIQTALEIEAVVLRVIIDLTERVVIDSSAKDAVHGVARN